MTYHTDSSVELHSFYYIYSTTIKPKLENIDIFLKSNSAPFDKHTVANLLDITYSQLLKTMHASNIIELNNITIFHIIMNLESPICNLINKQWKYNFTPNYTPAIISDIYDLDYDKVKLAFDEIGATSIDSNNLNLIFKRIHLAVFF